VQLGTSFEVLGRPKNPGHEPDARITAVSGDYAKTLGIAVERGRMISDADNATAPYVIAINDSLAKEFFPNEDPLQHQIDLGGKDTGMLRPYTIVGVIADQADDKIGKKVHPMLFVPYQQIPTTSLFYQGLLKTIVTFVVKTRGDVPVAPEMRAVFHQTAPDYALDNFKTMQTIVNESIFSERLGLYLIAAFAGLAVVMVIAGLYGVLAQLVSYRRREIGIRMALGARRSDILALMMSMGGRLVLVGVVIGLPASVLASQLLRNQLFGIKPLDPVAYAAVAVLLAMVAIVACYIPARRAAAVDPMIALRHE